MKAVFTAARRGRPGRGLGGDELGEARSVEDPAEAGALVTRGAAPLDEHRRAGSEATGPDGRRSISCRQEPLSDRPQLVDDDLSRPSRPDAIVVSECCCQHREDLTVAALVSRDLLGRLALRVGLGQLDDTGPAQRRAALELHVEAAELSEGPVVELLSEGAAQLTGEQAAQGQGPGQGDRERTLP